MSLRAATNPLCLNWLMLRNKYRSLVAVQHGFSFFVHLQDIQPVMLNSGKYQGNQGGPSIRYNKDFIFVWSKP